MAVTKLKMRLGDLLVREQIITDRQLTDALNAQRDTGRKLGDTLIDLGHIKEKQLLRFLAQQLDIPFFANEDCGVFFVFTILYTSSEELPFRPFRLDDINPKFRLLL